MAGEYLTAAEEAAYGRYALEAPERSVLERLFFLDDFDRQLVAKRRGDHNRLGFGLQLVTVSGVADGDRWWTANVQLTYSIQNDSAALGRRC